MSQFKEQALKYNEIMKQQKNHLKAIRGLDSGMSEHRPEEKQRIESDFSVRGQGTQQQSNLKGLQ